jgi:cytochrome P450
MNFDPYDRDVLDDPYPAYEELRAKTPVLYLEDYDVFVVSTYAELTAVKRDPLTFSSVNGMNVMYPAFLHAGPADVRRAAGGPTVEQVREAIRGSGRTPTRGVVGSDPPLHTHLRRMVTKPFLPRAVAEVAPRVRQIAESLVDDLMAANEEGSADLAAQLTYPFPVIVIAEMLGIPSERWEDFKRWSHDGLSVGVGDSRGEVVSDEQRAASTAEMHVFFEQVIDDRRKRPGPDLVSALIETAGTGDDPLNTEELIGFANLLLVAGNETTTNLLSNLWCALMAHPDQLRRLRDDPSLLDSATEEAMRYDAPVQCLFRSTTRQVVVGDVSLPPEAAVMTLYGSANRDENHYERAAAFLIDRNPTDHVGFGHGIHYCLGAPLARLETRIATEVLLSRAAGVEVSGPPVRLGNPVFRGMRSMPVALEPA